MYKCFPLTYKTLQVQRDLLTFLSYGLVLYLRYLAVTFEKGHSNNSECTKKILKGFDLCIQSHSHPWYFCSVPYSVACYNPHYSEQEVQSI